MNTASPFPAILFTTIVAGSCGNAIPARGETTPSRSAPLRELVVEAPVETGQDGAMQQTPNSGAACGEPVANLPFARGRTFTRLDEYLAYLEQQGAIDLPWWRQIGRGVYERVVRMPEAERETATREQLMERFGFKC